MASSPQFEQAAVQIITIRICLPTAQATAGTPQSPTICVVNTLSNIPSSIIITLNIGRPQIKPAISLAEIYSPRIAQITRMQNEWNSWIFVTRKRFIRNLERFNHEPISSGGLRPPQYQGEYKSSLLISTDAIKSHGYQNSSNKESSLDSLFSHQHDINRID